MDIIDDPITHLTPTVNELVSNAEDNPILFHSDNVYVSESKIHGIGVFAKKNLTIRENIEVFPIVPLPFRTHYQGDGRVIDYSVVKQCPCEECKKHGLLIFLRLGYGGIYNHQDNPNAELSMDYAKTMGICKAIKNINKDEEIFINYGPNFHFMNGKNIAK
jgi:hypothetical protein